MYTIAHLLANATARIPGMGSARQSFAKDGNEIGGLRNKHGHSRGEHRHGGDRHDRPSQA